MVTNIDTAALRQLLDGDGAQLLEVLPAAEYRDEHLPGAVNLPLTDMTTETVAELDPAKPTVVYCFDYQCDLSPRAAHRLEQLGFTDVYDYVPGKAAWLGEGLPSEGARRPEQRIGSIADPDVPRVPATATVGEAREVVGDQDVGIVVDADDVVLGVLRPEALDLDATTPVRDVLQPGPSTFRPSMTIKEMVEYFRKSDENRAIVSSLTGQWIGLIRRSDLLDD